MLYNSFSFAFFLVIVFFIYWNVQNKYKAALLLICSYYFYFGFGVKYVFLLLFTTVISYVLAIFIENEQKNSRKKVYLTLSCIICLGLLISFKYLGLIIESVFTILSVLSIRISEPVVNLLLPVGISFYAFRIISYVADVYYGKVKAERCFIIYATYVSFFPLIVAGPIERADKLILQIKGNHVFNEQKALYGVKLLLWGYYKKLVIADNAAKYVDTVYSNVREYAGFNLLLIIFLFTIQIYCDFSGYSDIAIGTAKLLDIDIERNFRSPYLSGSVKEFWSRWHISLSTWFRDYVYIPLGGNRCSSVRRNINLMITFLLSGLWHGANWTFVIWGGIHGIIQIVEKSIEEKVGRITKTKIGRVLRTFIVFIFCNLAWVFFRAESIGDAFYVICNALDGIINPKMYFKTQLISESNFVILLLEILVLAVFDFYDKDRDVINESGKWNKVLQWGTWVVLGIVVVYFSNRAITDFIYSQF